MRCNNCGFDNPAGRMRCEKCNAPMQGSMVDQGQHQESQSTSDGYAGTIKGDQVNADPWDCPKCGRPIIPGAGSCNYCGHVLGNQAAPPPVAEVKIEQEQQFRKKGLEPKGTIDPYQKGFVLKPIPTDYEEELPSVKLKADSDTVELGRDILESANNTISALQATMINRNGKWYIKNESSKNSTFVFAADYMEIQDGDVIMMGNRKFIFTK